MVTSAYKAVESAKLAKEAAENLVADLKEGATLGRVAKKAKYEIEETGEFTRSYSPFVPRLGSSEELSKAAFEVPEDQVAIEQVFDIQNRFVVAEIKERVAANMDELDAAKREELSKTIFNRKQTEIIKNRLDELRSTAAITISPRVMDLLNKEN